MEMSEVEKIKIADNLIDHVRELARLRKERNKWRARAKKQQKASDKRTQRKQVFARSSKKLTSLKNRTMVGRRS